MTDIIAERICSPGRRIITNQHTRKKQVQELDNIGPEGQSTDPSDVKTTSEQGPRNSYRYGSRIHALRPNSKITINNSSLNIKELV